LASYDDEKVTALSSELMQACGRLKDLGRMEKEVVVRDLHLIASAKYHLIVGIEAAIDLANHLIARNRGEPRRTTQIHSASWRSTALLMQDLQNAFKEWHDSGTA